MPDPSAVFVAAPSADHAARHLGVLAAVPDEQAVEWAPDADTLEIPTVLPTAAPPPRPPGVEVAPPPIRPPGSHRRRDHPTPDAASRSHRLDPTLGALTALFGAMASVFGGILACDPLRYVAYDGVPDGLEYAWPALVYASWSAAASVILYAARRRRQAPNSWIIMASCATIGTASCTQPTPHTPSTLAIAAIPPLAALLCFHLFTRQLARPEPLPHTTTNPIQPPP
ncbi:DUF2637 domain-containing protein [Embleya sp. NBC_00896]|uniref:DUF2637 domain-containing protein n=1 Tax=Embleya sp. NBC_00896 TaxID=2975961 RepID=UPI002F911612|nr:DUF2637 domain-containing protein [Embleya sp. NBC_00896]